MIGLLRMSLSSGPIPPAPRQPSPTGTRVYTLLVYDDVVRTPWVTLLDADDDQQAIRKAHAHHPTKRRELWDKHRLVAVIEQSSGSNRRA